MRQQACQSDLQEKLPLDTLCHDEEVVKAYMADPLVNLNPVPARVGAQLLKIMTEVSS